MFITDCFVKLLTLLIRCIDSIIDFFNKSKPVSEYIIFYDLETTGLNPYHSKIIEIGAMLYSVKDNEVIDRFSSNDYAPKGAHLSIEGYRKVAELITRKLAK